MLLYVGMTFWVFILLIIGIRPDSKEVAENWPYPPKSYVARSNKRIISAMTTLTFLFFWFLTAFRSAQIGNDTNTYLYYFDLFSQGVDVSTRFEIGYQYLNFIIGKITTDHHSFIIIIASLMYFGVVWYIYRFSKNIPLSLCLFYCYFFSIFMSIFRQGIAMIIVMYGYHYLKQEKKHLAFVLFLLAITFHSTAIVCFLLFFSTNLCFKKRFVLGGVIVCSLLGGGNVIFSIVERLFPMYIHYFSSRYASSGWLAVTYSVITYLIWYFLIVKSLNENEKKDRLVALNFALMVLFSALGYTVNLSTRISQYFLLISLIEIPNILYRGHIKHYRLCLFILCTILLINFIVVLIYRPEWNYLYPYEFWS